MDFRHKIVNTYFQKYGKNLVDSCWPLRSLSFSDSWVFDNIGYDSLDYLVSFTPDEKKGDDVVGIVVNKLDE